MKYLIGNWKMYLNHAESVKLASQLAKQYKKNSAVTVGVCPSFTSLADVGKVLVKTEIGLGAQDVFWTGVGAYTGEASPRVLKELGCDYAIVGHSERRGILGETNEMVQKKMSAAIEYGLIPVLCVGETKEEREAGEAKKVVKTELDECLSGLNLNKMKTLLVAYEPIWAIGTGQAADIEQIREMHAFIKKWLTKEYLSLGIRKKIHVIYGGSVDEKNITGYLTDPLVEGALVGGASVRPGEFLKIIDLVSKL